MGRSNRVPGRATPVDPLWYRRGWVLRVECACRPGHKDFPVQELLDGGKARPEDRVWQVVARMSCEACQARPARSELLTVAESRMDPLLRRLM